MLKTAKATCPDGVKWLLALYDAKIIKIFNINVDFVA